MSEKELRLVANKFTGDTQVVTVPKGARIKDPIWKDCTRKRAAPKKRDKR